MYEKSGYGSRSQAHRFENVGQDKESNRTKHTTWGIIELLKLRCLCHNKQTKVYAQVDRNEEVRGPFDEEDSSTNGEENGSTS